MKKIEKNKKEKHENILRAAQEIFQSSGFIGAGMDKIAKKACVTKQTVYRYFNSKEELFKETLEAQRLRSDNNFMDALNIEDSRKALIKFAEGFIKRHISKEHLSNVRLLVAEGPEVPEITKSFYAVGPEKTKERLLEFIKKRFRADRAEFEISVFINTLISMRTPVLTGLAELPSDEEISDHAEKSVEMLMKLIGQ